MQTLHGVSTLVTGAAGFVGSHLVRRLLNEGAAVHIFVKPSTSIQRLDGLSRDLNVALGDVTNVADVRACLRSTRPSVIFHLAGSRHLHRDIDLVDKSLQSNLHGTVTLCKTAHQEDIPLRCFIQTGSFEEYGDGPVPFDERQREQAVSPYSASKVAATQFCQMMHRCFGFPAVVLRSCHLYGPQQAQDTLIPGFVATCLDGNNIELTSGEQTRDFGYVSDMVEAYILAATNPAAIGEVINIGTGEEVAIKDIAQRVVNEMGNNVELRIGALARRTADVQRGFGRNAKAKRLLGWSPKVGLDSGLKKTIAYYQSPVV